MAKIGPMEHPEIMFFINGFHVIINRFHTFINRFYMLIKINRTKKSWKRSKKSSTDENLKGA